ncbi:MAG: hypothetical protein HYY23_04130, partial [Verrucomicrobia bacterium]|nr:hypothetical protein [Verrucomicrobiota bacterium]
QRVLPPLPHDEGVLYAIFSPDGQRIATISGNNAARVWDAANGEGLTPHLRHARQVTHLAFSPDSKVLVTTSANLIRIWDANTGEPVTPPIMHPDAVFSAEFGPDGERIVTGCRDGRARVWNLRPYHLDKEEMILWTQLLSAHRIDRAGTDLEPLSLGTLSNAWHKLRSKPSRLLAAP